MTQLGIFSRIFFLHDWNHQKPVNIYGPPLKEIGNDDYKWINCIWEFGMGKWNGKLKNNLYYYIPPKDYWFSTQIPIPRCLLFSVWAPSSYSGSQLRCHQIMILDSSFEHHSEYPNLIWIWFSDTSENFPRDILLDIHR